MWWNRMRMEDVERSKYFGRASGKRSLARCLCDLRQLPLLFQFQHDHLSFRNFSYCKMTFHYNVLYSNGRVQLRVFDAPNSYMTAKMRRDSLTLSSPNLLCEAISSSPAK
jgi:hypothetical protein